MKSTLRTIVFFLKRNPGFLLLLLLLGVSAYLMVLCIHDGHRWDDDYSMYIAQAKSILSGTEMQLLQQNRFCMENSLFETGPYLYPFGYPLILAPVYYFSGLNFIGMKILNVLFFMSSMFLLYALFRKYITDFFFLFCLLMILVLNREVVEFSDFIYSDFSFLFFCCLAFYRMEKKVSLQNQLITGAIIYYAYFIRDAGIFLIPALVTYQWFVQRQMKNSKGDRMLLFLPYLVFVVLLLVSAIWFPKGSNNLVKLLFTKFTVGELKLLLMFYAELLTEFIFSFKSHGILFFLAFTTIITGMIWRWKSHLHFVVFVIGSFMLLMIFPNTQGLRYLFPILPFLLYFLMNGIQFYLQRFPVRSAYAKPFIVVLLITATQRNISQIIGFSSYDTNQAYSAEMQATYAYIRNHIPATAVIGFIKPRGLRLYTDRPTILTDEFHFNASIAQYFLTDKNEKTIPVTAQSKMFETAHFVLLKK